MQCPLLIAEDGRSCGVGGSQWFNYLNSGSASSSSRNTLKLPGNLNRQLGVFHRLLSSSPAVRENHYLCSN